MVDFRKMLLLLVVAFVAVASAQINPLQCVANAGVPPLARAEGVAEEVGQVIINCTGGASTPLGVAIPTINVQIFLNTNITSRLLASSSINSEAMLLIDEPQPVGTVGAASTQLFAGSAPYTGVVTGMGNGQYGGGVTGRPNVFQGQQAGANSIVWLNVPFDPPGTTPNRVLRIVNVRANANQLGVSSTLIPTAINMFISISGTGSLALTNPQLTVAYVQVGMKFSATTASYNQCEPGSKIFTIKFAEMFGTAFRHQMQVTGVSQDIPGKIYNTESMFYGPALPSAAGVATQGTRLIARFSNVPANVTLSVPITGTSSDGNDLAVLVAAPTNGSTADSTGVVALTGGAGAAVWEITRGIPGAISTMPFDVTVSYKANPLPGLGTATVTGNYAPTTTVFTASYTEPVPRFVDNPQSAVTFTINSCQTNILFPFVTNQAGFDTGLVISNTSLDPYGTVPQRGPCTLYFYGATAGGGAAPGAQTSGTVNEGTQLIMTASGGGNLGLVAVPGFQGYVIARCNFQYGHGYAFVSDLGATRVAEGYLGLVLDQNMFSTSSTVTRTGAKSEPLDN